MKKIRKRDLVTILVIAIVFVIIIAANSNLIIRSMINQTRQVGQMQISSIKTDFENYIASAENSLIRVSSGAEQLLYDSDDRTALEDYIVAQKKSQMDSSNGVNFNVYIAGKDWQIIPDFDAPDDYHASERNWYIGAVENGGDIYITDPYIDSMTGEMCYTMSVMLPDGETVVAMDFTLSEIQESIGRMSLNAGSSAMIVTPDGLIVGYTDMSYVGKDLDKALPEYTGVLNKALENKQAEFFSYNLNGVWNTIFYSVTNNNWYMMLCVDDSRLYSTTTWQVVLNVLINLAMLAIIIILYVYTVRNRMKTEEALIGRELFVNRLVEKLKEPVNDIIKISSESGENGGFGKEEYEDIKSSGLRMNEIINDLSSYSSIVSNVEETKKSRKKELRDLSKTIRIFRNIIVALLVIIMLFGSYLYYQIGMNLSETLMQSEMESYMHQLEEWEKEQMTVLGMFTDMISANPKLMEDYDSAVEWLDSVAKKYPSISVCYLANPYSKHTVIMNNGWQPDPDWKVEERDWYKETEKSADGYSISSPYYDEQTGNYCITVSKMVYGKNGEFLGIFGIDLYMDKIIDIFGDSYGNGSYVFLVDSNGDIINHPNKDYEMTDVQKVNVKDTPYLEAYNAGESKIMTVKDYDGVKRVCLVWEDKSTGFSVILAWRWTEVYLFQLLHVLAFLAFSMAAIVAIILLLNKVIRSQANMNMKLSKAVKRAEDAGRAKSDFLAQMSHEIRTPINAVIGMDEMILRETDDRNIREYATDIKTASKTLLSLINGVLDFSKIESGNMEIISVKYETTGMIDTLVNMISSRAAKKGLELVPEIDADLPRVLYGDDVRIRQVITNLLTNAVKYTEKGTVTLIMRGENISDTECILYVEVKDTGIGIKEEDMDKLFQSFRRIDETRNRTIEGTGLGMSIVDGILKLMDSELQVESEYGKGSSFSFRISQNVVDRTPIGEYQRHHSVDENIAGNHEMKILKADILAVDDNEMNLKVVKGLMKKLEVVPDLASSGKEAIEKIKNKHYDILFIDHMMPEMDGIETLKKLKEESLIDESTVAIALTANAIAGAKEMYITEGFMDYLSKPIAPEEMEKLLAQYLPEGSYTYGDADITGSAEHSEKDFITELEKKGVNTKAALEYSMDDKEFYKELLETFVENHDEKAEEIKKHYDAGDWKNYKIQVHALKSSSRTLGMDKLSDMALGQENAAKESDEAAIRSGIEPLLEEYENAVSMIKEVIE